MATATFTGSKGHHTFTVTVEPVSTIPSVANTAYAYVTMTMYGGSYDFNYSSKSVSWSLNVGGAMFSGSFGTYTANSTLTLVSRQQVTIDVSGGDTSVTLNVTDGIGASYTTGDISSTKELPDFTTYYFTSVGKPGAPILTQNADGSILVQCTIGSAGTNNSATDVHVYYRWGNSTVSSTSGQYSGSLNLTKNSTTGYYEGTIAFSTVVSANTSSIYAVGYTIGSRSNSYASSVGSNKSIWSWTGVGAPSNVSVTYLAASNKFRVTGNAGSSGVNNDVTSVLWCWEIEGVSSERSCPYTWHGRYTTATEDHNRGTISCSAGASFSFDIPLANKNTTYYTFVIYTQGTYDNNYGGDYEGIHVIRNSYTGNSIVGLSTHTVHNISYGYTAAITDFSCWRVNELYRNVYDYYVTAGTSTVGINICGVQYNIKYFADEERSDLITREYYSDSCSAGEYIGGRLNYPTVPVNHIYLTIELYTLYDNTGKPSQIGPMTTYEMEMIRYTPCISPKLIFPNPETSIEKFIPFTGTSCT
ncbi:MAG: hypothetical protein IJA19_01280, partial [Clostridia bacterium]|nr:hypothetical protein [Clostridia bacterium]